MGEDVKGQEGYEPSILATYNDVLDKLEEDPFYNAQSFMRATYEFCEEISLMVNRCDNDTSLRNELLAMVQERRNLIAKVQEHPDF